MMWAPQWQNFGPKGGTMPTINMMTKTMLTDVPTWEEVIPERRERPWHYSIDDSWLAWVAVIVLWGGVLYAGQGIVRIFLHELAGYPLP